jgi:hypothetical protein
MTPIIRTGGEVTTPCCHYALLTDSNNPTRDWLAHVVGDVTQWAVEQGSAVVESALVVAQVGAAAHAQLGWVDACQMPAGCVLQCVQRVPGQTYNLNALFRAGLPGVQYVTHPSCCATTTTCPALHKTCYCCGDLFFCLTYCSPALVALLSCCQRLWTFMWGCSAQHWDWPSRCLRL